MEHPHTRICRHPKIPEFCAPAELWIAAGAGVYGNTDVVSVSSAYFGAPLLTEAWYRAGGDGTAALLWFLEERERRRHEDADRRAVNSMADAIKSAGASMRYDVELVLSKLPPRLRDRVRQLAEV